MKQTKWLGHEIDENGLNPNEKIVEAILKLKLPNNTKELKSFLGAIQYLANFLPKLSEKTNRLRKLLEKNEPWKWEKDQEDYTQLKRMLTEKSCLGHYAKDKENMVTTDLSKPGLGITLWQEQDSGGDIKPIAFGSRF